MLINYESKMNVINKDSRIFLNDSLPRLHERMSPGGFRDNSLGASGLRSIASPRLRGFKSISY